MDIVFIYRGPHNVHKDWANSVTNVQVPFINKRFSKMFTWSHPLVHQFLALFNRKIPKADVYFVENMPCILPVLLNRKKNSKIIVINSDTFFYELQSARFIKRKYFEFLLKHVDGLISTSEYMRNMASKYTKIPQKVIYPHIDYPKFAKISCDIKSANIGFISQISITKGSDLLFNVFKKIKKKYHNKMYLVGIIFDGFEKERSKNIIMPGVDLEPEKYMKHCGLYLNLSRNDPFGINVIEAMATGIPPIVSKTCGASEIVMKISPKLVVDLDEKEIIKRIDWLQSDIKRKQDISKKCKLVAESFSKENRIPLFRNEFLKFAKEIFQNNSPTITKK